MPVPPPPVVAKINALRVKNHLPVAKWTTAYTASLIEAIRKRSDPELPTGAGILASFGLWGTGSNADAVLNAWYYHDGWEGEQTSNLDCTSPSASVCGEHRRILLTRPRRGAQLFIDLVQRKVGRSVAVAAVLVWRVVQPYIGSRVVKAAEGQIGVPYVWGGESPGHGFDCSGLAAYAWGTVGVPLPHNAAEQYASIPHVPLSKLRPGDLVFYASDGEAVGHVVIYIGKGQVVQAEHTGTVVQVTPLWPGAVGAGRP